MNAGLERWEPFDFLQTSQVLFYAARKLNKVPIYILVTLELQLDNTQCQYAMLTLHSSSPNWLVHGLSNNHKEKDDHILSYYYIDFFLFFMIDFFIGYGESIVKVMQQECS